MTCILLDGLLLDGLLLDGLLLDGLADSLPNVTTPAGVSTCKYQHLTLPVLKIIAVADKTAPLQNL
jgi:hypothetical protein